MQQYSEIPFEIFTIDNLYTNDEIEEYLNYVETSDSKNPTFSNMEFKNGKIIKQELSNLFYSRISSHLPNNYIDRNSTMWKYLEASKFIFYSKLKQDESFMIHTDTGSVYDKINNKYSKYTVLTYLNDSFEGGQTKFYDKMFKNLVTITPKRNRTLIFDIDLFHSGEQVLSGNKYWIGTELICSKN
jgi:hypothetical protein